MGACSFYSYVERKGKPAGFNERVERGVKHLTKRYENWPNTQEAFRHARDEAAHESGHGGYSGTIAEKNDFTRISKVASKAEAYELASRMIENDDRRIADKWGPAGCIEIAGDEGGWLFFGFASS
jgi:hypothetical protein